MAEMADTHELVDHLVRSGTLRPGEARRVVGEVAAFFSAETAEDYVRRRHRELRGRGVPNPEIFARVARELCARPVAAPRLSERQVRRVIYG
jgi:hypothetical protein